MRNKRLAVCHGRLQWLIDVVRAAQWRRDFSDEDGWDLRTAELRRRWAEYCCVDWLTYAAIVNSHRDRATGTCCAATAADDYCWIDAKDHTSETTHIGSRLASRLTSAAVLHGWIHASHLRKFAIKHLWTLILLSNQREDLSIVARFTASKTLLHDRPVSVPP